MDTLKRSPLSRHLVDIVLAAAALILICLGIWMALFYAPLLRHYGLPWWSQKIFYLHVPCGWGAMMSMGLLLAFSMAYLKTGKEKYDELALACAEPGFVLCSAVLLSGPLWAKPSWNTYWVWEDPKLISFLAMWLLFGSYFLVRSFAGSRRDGRVAGAGLGILGALSLPFVFFSAKFLSSLHPPPVKMDSRVRNTLLVCLAGFVSLYFLQVRIRLRMERIRNLTERLRLRVAELED